LPYSFCAVFERGGKGGNYLKIKVMIYYKLI